MKISRLYIIVREALEMYFPLTKAIIIYSMNSVC